MKQNRIIDSFKHAFHGIGYCIKFERHFRIELCIAVFVTIVKQFYNFNHVENLGFFIIIALVLSSESINTAIEASVDLCTDKYNLLAKIAKDTAAGAVLINSIIAVVGGMYLFWDINNFKQIIDTIKNNVLFDLFIVCYIILSYIFIYKIFKNKEVVNDK